MSPRRSVPGSVFALLAAVLVLGMSGPATAIGVPAPCWTAPVPVPVAVPFVAPACTWCAGHRGLEFRPRPGTAVRAVTDGVVSFAGIVAGVRYLVVRGAGGRRVTYGSLATIRVRAGSRVRAGEEVGRAGPRLFLGLRQGNHHVDPAPLLCREVGRGRVRLLPPDG